ncbi:hypothetical protein H1R17_06275 [Flavobacterium sp. xlx-214]|uniref:hypothetical protein n=1 Tax=Flavobacterium sp. xlx-214 TaxID=2654325 RepID=UPI0013CFCCC1|nr:hypothetical protein [Flavobacterium sp. xlx-214]QMI84724.1 hypothetical protein H1R17_06275 [Flavobacterium sp. xlx-214]
MIINVAIVFVIFFCLISCNKTKKEELKQYLTNDSMAMWDITMKNFVELKDTSYYHHYYKSYLIYSNFVCDKFAKSRDGNRFIEFLGPKPNLIGLCNQWEIKNDSTIILNCKDVFVVKIINRDTLYLFDTLGIKKHEMYRDKTPWNIDEESVLIKNKQVESGEYLDPYIY